MADKEHDNQKNDQRNINNQTWQDFSKADSDSVNEGLNSNEKQANGEIKEDIPKLSEKEQAVINEKRNTPDFQNGLQNMLPKDNDIVQAKKDPENLDAKMKEWQDNMKPVGPDETNATGLPDKLKTGIESLSSIAMDDVRVHYNSSKPAEMNALAYAQGTDIHIASGQEKHLPHEAWHVVQQKQGRVKPTVQMKGKNGAVNDDDNLEKEADIMGAKALHNNNNDNDNVNKKNKNGNGTVKQLVGYTYKGSSEEQDSISSLVELKDAILDYLDFRADGVQALFLTGGIATTPSSWAIIIREQLTEENDLGELELDDFIDCIEGIKAENRKEELLKMVEFYNYYEGLKKVAPWDVDKLREYMQDDGILIEDQDVLTLTLIHQAEGERSSMAESLNQSYKIGSDTFDLDESGLKAKLNELLGETVNWGHEINDCAGDTGKRGELYYYQSGSELAAVGNSSQSHSSSKGGKTIIWEKSGSSIEILAIAKHTTKANSKLSKGASYQVAETYGSDYSGYKGKIIGFKSS